jgi:hypothetical protein
VCGDGIGGTTRILSRPPPPPARIEKPFAQITVVLRQVEEPA